MIQLKRVDFSRVYDYKHTLFATFKGKKTSAGHRGSYDVVLTVSDTADVDPAKHALAVAVLEKIKAKVNTLATNMYADSFSCYHDGHGVYFDVPAGYELLKPNRQGTVNLKMADILALDALL